jgi:hydrogenase maturation protein HypF
MSPHIGDLKTFEAYQYLCETIEHQSRILDVKPILVACDFHPDYQSTRWAEDSGLPVVHIQHHHAHCVALMTEHDVLDSEIIGLAMDGTGLGTDMAIWGGEIFLANKTDFRRLAHFNYAPLPGGDLATKEVWRAALGRLWTSEAGLDDDFLPIFNGIPPDRIAMVESMIRSDVNCPPVCSLGRLFDAAGFIAGIGEVAAFDGQVPMLLEAACEGSIELPETIYGCRDFDVDRYISGNEKDYILDGASLLRAMCRLRLARESRRNMARWFHHRVIVLLERISIIAREKTGIEIIGLTGGCFMNRFLHEELSARLRKHGFNVLTHRLTPTNDGCIALGQAICAAYRHPKS